MIFEIFDSSGKTLTDFEVVSYELSSEIAACLLYTSPSPRD